MASIISMLPAVARWLLLGGEVVVLIKPQFEAGPEQVGKGGIIRDPAVHRQVLEDVLGWSTAEGWTAGGMLRSPIQGAEGNVEFLARLRLAAGPAVALGPLVAAALAAG
jgi:23S rRNA (cytidine1920-2'-O)/16S rRNA (cytidine1409-2'-O)-methyltransferase